MAGHSQFKNIMHRKGAQDAKRAKKFAKMGREIMVAAKLGGEDPASNPRLRTALSMARGMNMPKDNVERAIKKAIGGNDQTIYEDIRYEGYGPSGTAFIVDVLTDNRNRTAAEIRSIFGKAGGNLGETGSVSYLFERVGLVIYPQRHTFDEVFEASVHAGAENVEEEDGYFYVTCPKDSFVSMRDQLIEIFGDPVEAKVIWQPLTKVACAEEKFAAVEKLFDQLDDNDDVQNVYANYVAQSD